MRQELLKELDDRAVSKLRRHLTTAERNFFFRLNRANLDRIDDYVINEYGTLIRGYIDDYISTRP